MITGLSVCFSLGIGRVLIAVNVMQMYFVLLLY